MHYIRRRGRGVKMLLGEQQEQLLFLHEWVGVELGRGERVLCEEEFNSADHPGQERWRRIPTVHRERCEHSDTWWTCLDWRPSSSYQQHCQLALDRRTTVWYFSFTLLDCLSLWQVCHVFGLCVCYSQLNSSLFKNLAKRPKEIQWIAWVLKYSKTHIIQKLQQKSNDRK